MEKSQRNTEGGWLSMILPKREDVFHKIQLFRLLTAIIDSDISRLVHFKGGTAASMLGFLDRFSIDLDFDLEKDAPQDKINKNLKTIFQKLDLEIDKKSSKTLYYILKYHTKQGFRNSIKLSFIDKIYKLNIYKPQYLSEIDRFANCQTVETMFANKLVALTDRYKKTKTIAGRDLYDIHHFFVSGYNYETKIIEERTGKKTEDYLRDLIKFIDKKINNKIIDEDLNFLLPVGHFKKIRPILKSETMMILKQEIERK